MAVVAEATRMAARATTARAASAVAMRADGGDSVCHRGVLLITGCGVLVGLTVAAEKVSVAKAREAVGAALVASTAVVAVRAVMAASKVARADGAEGERVVVGKGRYQSERSCATW